MAQRTTPTTRIRIRHLVSVATLAGALTIAAPVALADAAGDVAATVGETAPEPEPEPEPAPEPEPEPEPAPDDDDDATTALLGIVLLLLAIGVVAALIMSSRSSRPARRTAPPAARPTMRTHLVAGSRWVHDVGSVEVLRASDAATLAQTWGTVSAQMIDLESKASAAIGMTQNRNTRNALQQLSVALGVLRSVLAQDVALRSDPAQASRADLVQASAQTVQQRRLELDIALANPSLRAV